MLIDFTVKNFSSFKDENSLSMLASIDKTNENIHVFSINDKIRILKNAAIFGANASGKSNLLKALNFMLKYVINSSKESQLGDIIDVEPFKFNAETEKQPSLFEVTFLQENVIYRYGFEVTKTEVVSEWLFARYSSRESTLFIRKNQDITTLGEKFKEGRKYISSVRNNALFLSVCAQFNGVISSKIIEWFRNVSVISSLDNNYANHALQILDNENGKYSEQKEMLLHLITSIDVGIEDLSIEDENLDIKKFIESMPMKQAGKLLDELNNYKNKDSEENKGVKISARRVTTLHKKFDANNTMVSLESCNFNIESKGTRKIFELSGLIIKTIYDGGVLFIDEIQNSLHPNLIVGLINFINHNEKNKNAQFIYTTHEVLILAKKLLRRDQYWFVEKNKYGASELSCLFDYDEPIRKDASLDKDYLRGRYGAIPYLSL